MKTLVLELPVDGLPSPAELSENFADEARFLLALKLFEQGRFPSERPAGVPAADLSAQEMAEEFESPGWIEASSIPGR
jgi:hypothetical protein